MIAVALVATTFYGPFVGTGAADGGNFGVPGVDVPAQLFAADAPVGAGLFETNLMVPWTPDLTDDPLAIGYGNLTLTPSAGLLSGIDTSEVVRDVRTCAVPPRTGGIVISIGALFNEEVPPGGELPQLPAEPVGTENQSPQCLPLTRTDGPTTPLEYAVIPGTENVTIQLGMDNFAQTLLIDLRLTGRADPGTEQITLRAASDAWAPGTTTPETTEDLDFVVADHLVVRTGVGPAAVDAATVPQVLVAGTARDYTAIAVDSEGYYMATVAPEWSLQGDCGTVAATDADFTATLDAVNATGDGPDCILGASFGAANGTAGPITVRAGAPERLVTIIDDSGAEVGNLSFSVDGQTTLHAEIRDAHSNAVLDTGMARWSVVAVPGLEQQVEALISDVADAPGDAADLVCAFLSEASEGQSEAVCDEARVAPPLTVLVNNMAAAPGDTQAHVCAFLYATISDLCKVLLDDSGEGSEGGEGGLDHEDPEETAPDCGIVDPAIGPSTTFTATRATNETLDCRVVATLLGLDGEPLDDTDRTGMIHVIGNLASIRIEDAEGTEVGPGANTTDDALTLHARGYDHAGNPLGNIAVNWTVNDGIGTAEPASNSHTTTIDFRAVGTGSITAAIQLEGMDHIINDTTGDFTIGVGALAKIKTENLDGTVIENHDMTTDDTLAVHARGYDADDNLIDDVSVTWSRLGSLDAIPAGPSTSITFDPKTAGTTGHIKADHADGPSVTAGPIAVNVGALAILTIDCPTATLAGGQVDCDIVEGTDADENDVDTSSATFNATDSMGTSIPIAADGTFTAPNNTSLGPVTVTASQDNVTSPPLDVGIDPDVLASFALACGDATQTVGATAICTATDGVDQHGNPVALDSPMFTATNATGIELDDNGDGIFTLPEDATDSVQVSATDQGVTTDPVTIGLAAGPLAAFSVTCGETRTVNQTLSCDATGGVDSFDNPVGLVDPIFSVHNVSGTLIHTGSGTFTLPTTVAGNPLTVNATDQGITSNDVGLMLVADALAAFTIDCGPAEQNANTTVTCLVADATDAYGNPVAPVDPVFTATNATGGVIHTGNATFNLPEDLGAVTINATADSIESNHVTIDVVAGALATLTIECGDTSRVAGTNVTCTIVEAVDALGNPVNPANVAFSAIDGTGTQRDADGDGTFTLPALVVDGDVVVNATADGVESNLITIGLVAGPLDSFTIACGETTRTVGDAVNCIVTGGSDAGGNPVTPEGVVFSALDDAGNQLDTDGDGNFSLPILVEDGPVTVNAAAGSVVSNTIEVTLAAGPLAQVTIDCGNTMRTIADAVACVVTDARDAHGNSLTPTVVTFAALNGTGTDLDGDSDGTFTLPALVDDGPVNVTATADGVDSNTVTIELVPGPFSQVIATCPDEIQVGHSGTCVAGAFDAGGNELDHTISWSATGGFLSSQTGTSVSYTAPTTTAEHTVTASATDDEGTTFSDAEGVEVVPGDIFVIKITTLPAGETADVSADDNSVTIEAVAEDFFQNAVADGTEIFWTLGDPDAPNAVATGATDSGTGLAVGLDGGSSFTTGGVTSIGLQTSTVPGDDYKVTAKDDDMDPTTIRNSGVWTVIPGAPARAILECGVGGCTEAGDAVNVNITVQDQFENAAGAGYTGDKGWTFTGPAPAPNGDVPVCNGDVVNGTTETMVGFDHGTATVACTFFAAESFDLHAEDTTEDVSAFAPLAITVAPAEASAVVFIDDPVSEMIAGACTMFTVQVQDTYANPQPLGAYTVGLADGGLAGTFHPQEDCAAGPVTDVTLGEDVHTMNVFYNNNQSEDVVLALTGTLAGDTNDLTVHPADVAELLLACAAGCTVTAGADLVVTITAKDVHGNTVESGPHDYDGNHSIVLDGVAASPSDVDPTCLDNEGMAEVISGAGGVNLTFVAGTVTVTCHLPAAGAPVLGATDGSVSEAAVLDLVVEPDAATHFVATVTDGETFDPASGSNTGSPGTQTAGVGFDVALRALDQFGNLVDSGASAFNGTKALTFSGAGAAYDGTEQTARNETAGDQDFGEDTNVTFSDGVASTVLTLYLAETVADLSVTDGTISGAISTLTVDPAAATQVGILSEPVEACGGADGRDCILASESVTGETLAVAAGAEFTVRAASFDAYDNLVGSVKATWDSTGLAPDMGGISSFGLVWSFDEAAGGPPAVTLAGDAGSDQEGHSVELPVDLL